MQESHTESIKETEGQVRSVRGSVVDVYYPLALPPVYSLLRPETDAAIFIEVIDHIDEHNIRGMRFGSMARPSAIAA